jgi:hypothetical protein
VEGISDQGHVDAVQTAAVAHENIVDFGSVNQFVNVHQ